LQFPCPAYELNDSEAVCLCRKILNDKTGGSLAKRSLSRTTTIKDGEMAVAWHKYIAYCLSLAKKDFVNFKTTPRMSFSSILNNKGNMQQVSSLRDEVYDAFIQELASLLQRSNKL
jgi:hypothetical protein